MVDAAVAEALARHADVPAPAVRPVLSPEWRVRVVGLSGGEYVIDASSEADARTTAARFTHSHPIVEYRLAPPWSPAPLRAIGSADGDQGRDSTL
jgi:hypothetical protein